MITIIIDSWILKLLDTEISNTFFDDEFLKIKKNINFQKKMLTQKPTKLKMENDQSSNHHDMFNVFEFFISQLLLYIQN